MAKKPSKQQRPTSDGASGNVEHARCSHNNNRESQCGSQNNGRLSARFSADSTLSDSGHGRLSPYATPSATREVLERHGLYTKYALGQNFLVNDDIVRKIIELADVRPTDHVLEVGPGIGTLTSALLQKAGHVTSIEMDHDLPTVLQDTLAPWLGRFTLLEMDALDLREEHLQRASQGIGCDGGSASKGTVPKDDWEDSHLSQNDRLQSSLGTVPLDALPSDTLAGDGKESEGTVPIDDWSKNCLSEKGCRQSSMGTVPSDSFPESDHPQSSMGTAPSDSFPESDHPQSSMGTVPSDSFPLPNKLVSNLPYAVAATIMLDYLQRFPFLQSATVMVQKEVADRMMAKPGSKTYGAYTVKLGLHARAAGRFPVAPGNFFPPPHVESAVIRLDRALATDDAGNELSPELLKAACTMADAAFATRRKTLANSCKTYFSGSPDVQAALPDIFERAGIDTRRRGETLSQEEFIRLGAAYLGVLNNPVI